MTEDEARPRLLQLACQAQLRPLPRLAPPRRHACDPRRLLAHQAEAEIGGRYALRAAAGAGVADEIRDIGAVGTFGDAHAAVHGRFAGIAGRVGARAHEAGRGPLPDIAGEIFDAVLVRTEPAERIGCRVEEVTLGFTLVAADPALRWICCVHRKAVVPESRARGKGPFHVARQAVTV